MLRHTLVFNFNLLGGEGMVAGADEYGADRKTNLPFTPEEVVVRQITADGQSSVGGLITYIGCDCVLNNVLGCFGSSAPEGVMEYPADATYAGSPEFTVTPTAASVFSVNATPNSVYMINKSVESMKFTFTLNGTTTLGNPKLVNSTLNLNAVAGANTTVAATVAVVLEFRARATGPSHTGATYGSGSAAGVIVSDNKKHFAAKK